MERLLPVRKQIGKLSRLGIPNDFVERFKLADGSDVIIVDAEDHIKVIPVDSEEGKRVIDVATSV